MSLSCAGEETRFRLYNNSHPLNLLQRGSTQAVCRCCCSLCLKNSFSISDQVQFFFPLDLQNYPFITFQTFCFGTKMQPRNAFSSSSGLVFWNSLSFNISVFGCSILAGLISKWTVELSLSSVKPFPNKCSQLIFQVISIITCHHHHCYHCDLQTTYYKPGTLLKVSSSLNDLYWQEVDIEL